VRRLFETHRRCVSKTQEQRAFIPIYRSHPGFRSLIRSTAWQWLSGQAAKAASVIQPRPLAERANRRTEIGEHHLAQGAVAAIRLPRRLDRHGHDDRRRVIGAFDEFNLLDLIRSLGMHCKIADLPAAQGEGELRVGYVHAANVIGKV
jgi:hypothetical protein